LIFWKNSELNMINVIYFNPSNKYLEHPDGMQLNPYIVSTERVSLRETAQ
jgi:hypothetical protein